jgi:hypothetical protein
VSISDTKRTDNLRVFPGHNISSGGLLLLLGRSLLKSCEQQEASVREDNGYNDGKGTYEYLIDVAVLLNSSAQNTDAQKMNKDVNSAQENKRGD